MCISFYLFPIDDLLCIPSKSHSTTIATSSLYNKRAQPQRDESFNEEIVVYTYYNYKPTLPGNQTARSACTCVSNFRVALIFVLAVTVTVTRIVCQTRGYEVPTTKWIRPLVAWTPSNATFTPSGSSCHSCQAPEFFVTVLPGSCCRQYPPSIQQWCYFGDNMTQNNMISSAQLNGCQLLRFLWIGDYADTGSIICVCFGLGICGIKEYGFNIH
jgi:hypothetical protein